MRKLFLVLPLLVGCYQQAIVLSPAPAGEFRAVPTREAYRHDVVLFVNPTEATRARCALFSGVHSQSDLLVPLADGRIGLAYQPLAVFEVGHPRTVSGFEQRPGELALAGFRSGLSYSYLCTHNRALFGGTVDVTFHTFRLEADRLLAEQYYRPSYYGGTPLVDFVNHVEYLYGRSGAYALNEFRFTFDVPGMLMKVIR